MDSRQETVWSTAMDDQTQPSGPPPPAEPVRFDDGGVWSMIGTLVAGPVVWGGIGFGIDRVTESSGTYAAVGVLVGFVTSMYIMYVRHIRA